MTRFTLLALLVFGLVGTASAQAQTEEEAPATTEETVSDDATAAPELDPERAKTLYDEGVALLQDGDREGALVKFDESLVYNPASSATQLRRGQALVPLNRLEEAQTAFATAVELAEASDADGSDRNAAAAQRALDQITAALESRAAAAAQAEADAAANETQGKVNQAVGLLQAINIVDGETDYYQTAAEAYALLEQARMAGYDADLVAEYYAIALVNMEQGADAVPYAETALANADAAGDNSRLQILLGQAHMGAGNTDAARAAFEAVAEGQGWHGWAAHYLGQLEG